MFGSLKFVGIRFEGFWTIQLMILALSLFSLAVIFWNRPTREVLARIWTRRLFFLRIVSGLILALFVFNPTLVFLRKSHVRGRVAVLIDTSQSMEKKDSAGGLSRLESVKKLLSQGSLFSDISKQAEPVFFSFDRKIDPIPGIQNIPSLKPEGSATDLAGAIAHLRNIAPQEGWAGAILFTDGGSNVPGSPVDKALSLGCPVYCIGIGSPYPSDGIIKDRAITRIRTNPRAVTKQPVPVRISLDQAGFEGEQITLSLEANDRILGETKVLLSREKNQEAFIEFTPEQKGIVQLKLRMNPDSRDSAPENDAVEFSIPVTDSRLKILYIEGTLRWEYRFLKRTLAADPMLEPVFFIRTAADSAYLQEGGDAQAKPTGETLEDLMPYDCILLGDIPRAFLSDRQIAALESFVREKGKGLVFTGGFHILCSGEYNNTAFASLLPVKLPPNAGFAIPEADYALALDPSASGSDILRGLAPEISQVKLSRWYPVFEKKAGAEVLIKRRTSKGEEGIFLAAQSYGKGRVLFFATDELWHVSFTRKKKDEAGIAERLYLQGIRWAAGQTPVRDQDAPLFFSRLDSVYYEPGAGGNVFVKWNEGKTKGMETKLDAELAQGERSLAKLDFTRTQSGEFTAHFDPETDGIFEIRIRGAAGKEEETQILKFLAGRPHREQECARINEILLAAISQETKGGYYNLQSAGEILKKISREEKIVRNRVEREIAGSPVWFLLLVICLALEWYFRRRKGLV